ncbi:hypothetical protein [Streptomyces pseudovenezuelae]|uniref:hypothetical protein n=1 Tax=Streptomyces pseudovenezuelae TaxID=67350 RepID=UPI0036E2535F
MSDKTEPVRARPWRAEDGAPPVVWTWPYRDSPALWVWSAGRWRWATVAARQDWADGRTAYQVVFDPVGDTTSTHRTYWWPHPGLRVAHRSTVEPSTGRVEAGDMPVPPRRHG